jgi:hypothetical protein
VVFAVIATGVGRFICCQPDAVSFVNVTLASRWPVRDHTLPTCVPLFVANL